MLKTFQDVAASIKSPKTATVYQFALQKYMQYRKVSNLQELLEVDNNVRLIDSIIVGYLIYLKQERRTSWSFRNVQLAAIKHFYRMNDIELNWFKVGKYLGEHTRIVKDRAYTTEEIQLILAKADERMRCVVLLLVSTGMRVGAIPSLKLRNITKIKDPHLYQITLYENSPEESICFCSPEAASALDSYLLFREKHGEKLNPSSPLIREMFNVNDLLKIHYPRPNTENTLAANLRNLLVRAGINTVAHLTEGSLIGRERKPVARFNGFRKYFFNATVKAKLSPESRELLLSHSIQLGDSYYRPTSDELLQEYEKAIDYLTISNENRLTKKVQQLTIRSDKLDELHDEVKSLRARSERFDKFLASTDELQKKITEANKRLGLD